jgi:hypothetical protein
LDRCVVAWARLVFMLPRTNRQLVHV